MGEEPQSTIIEPGFKQGEQKAGHKYIQNGKLLWCEERGNLTKTKRRIEKQTNKTKIPH